MKIGILGWGSLIWDPRNLRTDGVWRPDGPYLPIEFSRVSSGGHLTLVIDERNGTQVRAYWTLSLLKSLNRAVQNLAEREGCDIGKIGFVLSTATGQYGQRERDGRSYRCRVANVLPELRSWINQSECDAVIWADLEPNFEGKTRVPFSGENVVTYLRTLEDGARQKAEEYVRKAPVQTETAVRQRARSELGWTNLSEG